MRLTTKGRYAVTAMLDIALHGSERAVKVAEVSRRQGISRSYLEHLLGHLHQSGLVQSTHGPGGGYQLARGKDRISIADIIDAVEEVDATQCHGKRDCRDGRECMTHVLWENLNLHIAHYLSSVTLAALIEERQRKESPEAGHVWMPIQDPRAVSGANLEMK